MEHWNLQGEFGILSSGNTIVKRNWLIGYRIVEEGLKGTTRTDNYGKEIMKALSKSLTEEYGKGFDVGSLYKFKKFYEVFPNILDSLSPKSSGQILSWTQKPNNL